MSQAITAPFRRYPNFSLLLFALFMSTVAMLAQSVTLGWQVYSIARVDHSVEQSSFLVGMIGLAQFLPMFALVLLAGETADRYDRRKILLGCCALQIFCSSSLALLADVACVVVFCTIGRRSHAEGITLGGVAETAWPFLTGTAVGWLTARAWRRPTVVTPTGLVVWIATVAVGMLLRKLTSQGTALSFVVVATIVTAVLLVGWRGVAAALARR